MALRIEAQLHGDGSSFFAMMGKAELASKRLAGTMLGPLKSAIAGAFTVGAAAGITRSIISMASHFRDLADQLGVNVEWLQAFSVAARQAGASEDDLAKMMLQVNRARASAVGGNGTAMAAFGRLGFSPGEVAGMPIQNFMERIFKAFEGGQNQSLLPIMQSLGIRASAKLSAAFSEGIIATAKAAKDSGAIMAEDVVDQLDEIGDKFEILKTRALVGLAPLIVEVANCLLTLTQAARISFSVFRAASKSAFQILTGIGTPSEDVTGVHKTIAGIMGENIGAENLQDVRKRTRRKIENSGPGFIPQVSATAKIAGSTDALTGVGNFLGAGLSSSLTAIGVETNRILKRSEKLLQTISENILELGGFDLGVPGA